MKQLCVRTYKKIQAPISLPPPEFYIHANKKVLQTNFTNHEQTIKSMCSECTAISASLTKIQSCVLQDITPLDHFQLKGIFDTIITGCRVLFACLEQDLEKLSAEAPAIRSWKPWSSVSKSNGDWDQKRMSRYLADARMQQGALILLNEFLMM